MRTLSEFASRNLVLSQVLITLASIILALTGILLGMLLWGDTGIRWENALATGFAIFLCLHLVHSWHRLTVRPTLMQRWMYRGGLYFAALVMAVGLGLRTGENQDLLEKYSNTEVKEVHAVSQVSPEVAARTGVQGAWFKFKRWFAEKTLFIRRQADESLWWRASLYVLTFLVSVFLIPFAVAASCALLCSDLAVLGVLVLLGGPLISLIGGPFAYLGIFGIKEPAQRRRGFWLSFLATILGILLVILLINAAEMAALAILAGLGIAGLLIGLILLAARMRQETGVASP